MTIDAVQGLAIPDLESLEVVIAVAFLVLFASVVALLILGRRKQGKEIREIVMAIEELRAGHGRHRADVSPRSPLSLISDSVHRLSQDLVIRSAEADEAVARFRALLQAEPDTGVITTDDEITIRTFSQAAERQFGWDEDEVRGSPLSILLDAASWEQLLPRMTRRTLREEGLRVEATLRRKDGSLFPGEIAVRSVRRDREGDRGGFLVAVRDASRKTEIELRLDEAESRYRRLVEGLGVGVAVTARGLVEFANPAFAALVGAGSPDDLVGTPFRDFVATRDVLSVAEWIERMNEGEMTRSDLEFRLRIEGAAAGRLVRAEAARSEHAGRAVVLVVLFDETSERRLEDELRGNQLRLDAVLEATAEGILALNDTPDGGVVHLTNGAFLEMFGLRQSHVLGVSEGSLLRTLRELGGGAETVAAFLASADGTDRRETVTLAGVPPREVELRSVPLRSRHGERLGRMLACRDTTEAKHSEVRLTETAEELRRGMAELEDAYRRLEQSNEDLERQRLQLEEFNREIRKLDAMKSNLLANVSHELQTPLVSIRGYTEMILKGRLGQVSDEQRKGLELSLRNIDRLIAMIDNLLEFSRMEREGGELVLRDFVLEEVVRECGDLQRPDMERRNISWSVDIEGPPLVIHADRDKILEVFLNLVSNAVKYNREGGKVEVRARARSDGFAMVQVRDTGVGIAPEDLERIFDRYYQAQDKDGSGLGLSIVRNILRLHGCTIRARSRKGEGTVFSFTLPLGERGEHEREPMQEEEDDLRMHPDDSTGSEETGSIEEAPDPGEPEPPRLRIIRPAAKDR